MSTEAGFDVQSFVESIVQRRNARGELVDKIGSSHNTFLDLDDIVPFLLHFGKDEFVRQQLLLSMYHTKNGFIDVDGYIHSWRMDEYLGGVSSYLSAHSNDADIRELFYEQLGFLSNYLEMGYIPSYYDVRKERYSRIVSPWGYQLVEVVLGADQIGDEHKVKFIELLRKFINSNRYFQNHGLFLSKNLVNGKTWNVNLWPFGSSQIMDRSYVRDTSYLFDMDSSKAKVYRFVQSYVPLSRVQFMKDNTNIVFALIEAYKYSKNELFKTALEKWIDSVLRSLYDERGFVFKILQGKNRWAPGLSQSFTFVDILCDVYFFVEKKQEYLRLAEDVCKFWLGQRMKNGLVPRSPLVHWDNLDEQTDFSVSLRRVAELSGKQAYAEEGRALFESILEHHLRERGFVTSLYSNSELRDNTVVTRFQTLFLKSHIIHEEGNYIYSNLSIHNLVKDR